MEWSIWFSEKRLCGGHTLERQERQPLGRRRIKSAEERILRLDRYLHKTLRSEKVIESESSKSTSGIKVRIVWLSQSEFSKIGSQIASSRFTFPTLRRVSQLQHSRIVAFSASLPRSHDRSNAFHPPTPLNAEFTGQIWYVCGSTEVCLASRL
jgi:hypothetical protein